MDTFVTKMTTVKEANYVDAALLITIFMAGFLAVLYAF